MTSAEKFPRCYRTVRRKSDACGRSTDCRVIRLALIFVEKSDGIFFSESASRATSFCGHVENESARERERESSGEIEKLPQEYVIYLYP